jgi:hypothetical protein
VEDGRTFDRISDTKRAKLTETPIRLNESGLNTLTSALMCKLDGDKTNEGRTGLGVLNCSACGHSCVCYELSLNRT